MLIKDILLLCCVMWQLKKKFLVQQESHRCFHKRQWKCILWASKKRSGSEAGRNQAEGTTQSKTPENETLAQPGPCLGLHTPQQLEGRGKKSRWRNNGMAGGEGIHCGATSPGPAGAANKDAANPHCGTVLCLHSLIASSLYHTHTHTHIEMPHIQPSETTCNTRLPRSRDKGTS